MIDIEVPHDRNFKKKEIREIPRAKKELEMWKIKGQSNPME